METVVWSGGVLVMVFVMTMILALQIQITAVQRELAELQSKRRK